MVRKLIIAKILQGGGGWPSVYSLCALCAHLVCLGVFVRTHARGTNYCSTEVKKSTQKLKRGGVYKSRRYPRNRELEGPTRSCAHLLAHVCATVAKALGAMCCHSVPNTAPKTRSPHRGKASRQVATTLGAKRSVLRPALVAKRGASAFD